jgi:hypothetical protein
MKKITWNMILNDFKKLFPEVYKTCNRFAKYDYMKIIGHQADGFYIVYDGLNHKLIRSSEGDSRLDELNNKERDLVSDDIFYARKGQPKKQKRNCEVCQLRAQGYSLRKIAEELGVSHVRIHQILKEYDDILKTQNYDA